MHSNHEFGAKVVYSDYHSSEGLGVLALKALTPFILSVSLFKLGSIFPLISSSFLLSG